MNTMKTSLQFILSVFIFFILILFSTGLTIPEPTQASDIDELYDELEDIEKELAQIRKEQQDLNDLIASEQEVQDSLAYEIQSLSYSISLLELDIKEKETEIERKETKIKILEEEIVDAEQLIANLGGDIETLELTAQDIIKSIYIDSKTNSALDILLQGEDSASFVSDLQYYTALGRNEQDTLAQLQSEREILESQKQKKEDNKIEIEKLAEQIRLEKENLEKDREQLALQQNQKNYLLAQSQQNENSYQERLENLSDEEKMKIAEQNKIKQEIFNQVGQITTGQYVLKGTIIGREGETGYAFGEHLHFTITEDGFKHWGELYWTCAVYGCNPNPCNYLPNNGICGISNSSLEWPMRGSFTLTSPWGERWGKWHDAIDIAYYWGTTDDYIYAAHDGWIQYGTSPCYDPNCNGDLKWAVICENKDDCNVGFKSGYYHLE